MNNRENNVVWVTGARGFIGRHLCSTLTKQGVDLTKFVRPGGAPKLEQNERELTAESIRGAFDGAGEPDVVFHLAGGSTVGGSLVDPLADYSANCQTLFFILDALRDSHCRIVVASSAAVYGHQSSDQGMSHDMIPNPVSPYGYHKLCSERLAKMVGERHGTRLAVCRLFSVYGDGLTKQLPFELSRRICSADYGNEIMLGGSGLERRDWVNVEDVVSALCISATNASEEVPIFNVGTGIGTSIGDMASWLSSAFDRGDLTIRFSGEQRTGDPTDLFPAAGTLPPGFCPKVSLQTGVKEYARWFKGRFGIEF